MSLGQVADVGSRHIRYDEGHDDEARIGRREVEAGRRVSLSRAVCG